MLIHRDGGRGGRRDSGQVDEAPVLYRVDTADEVKYYRIGGILHYALREMARAA